MAIGWSRTRHPTVFIEVTAAPKPAVPVPVGVVVGGVRLEFDQLPPAEYIVALGRAAC